MAFPGNDDEVAIVKEDAGQVRDQEQREVCQYSAAHKMAGVAATTTMETATVGTVPCCAECAAFYERMGS